MSSSETYVRLDENGAMRVGRTRVMLDSVVAAFEQGHSPETICQQYPALSLEDVYGAIAYFLGHREEVAEYVKRQADVWRKWETRGERDARPVVQRLRAQGAAKSPHMS